MKRLRLYGQEGDGSRMDNARGHALGRSDSAALNRY
ncbi:hypothetical protein BH10ACT2_BH10ACT2_04120 [soil metagenome]